MDSFGKEDIIKFLKKTSSLPVPKIREQQILNLSKFFINSIQGDLYKLFCKEASLNMNGYNVYNHIF